MVVTGDAGSTDANEARGVDRALLKLHNHPLASANTPVNQVPNIPYWQNLFPNAAGVTNFGPATAGCGDGNAAAGHGGAPGLLNVANPTATQAMYELFFCNWGSSTLGASNFVNIFDSFCFPACANINGVDTPYAFYIREFSALYAWSSLGSSAYNSGQFTLRSKPQLDLAWRGVLSLLGHLGDYKDTGNSQVMNKKRRFNWLAALSPR